MEPRSDVQVARSDGHEERTRAERRGRAGFARIAREGIDAAVLADAQFRQPQLSSPSALVTADKTCATRNGFVR